MTTSRRGFLASAVVMLVVPSLPARETYGPVSSWKTIGDQALNQYLRDISTLSALERQQILLNGGEE